MGSALKMFEAEIEHAKIVANMEIDQSYVNLGLDYVLVDPSRLLQVVSTRNTFLTPGTNPSLLDHQLPLQLDQVYKIREREENHCQTRCFGHKAYTRRLWNCILESTQRFE